MGLERKRPPLTAKQENYLRAFDASLHDVSFGGALGQELLQVTLDEMLDEASPTLRARIQERRETMSDDDRRAGRVRWQRKQRGAHDRRVGERRASDRREFERPHDRRRRPRRRR